MLQTRVTIGWRDLTGERSTEPDVIEFVKSLNRTSALISLARINTLLAIDRFHSTNELTIKIQGFLVSNFLDDDLFSRLKKKFGAERLDVRSIIHSQQVLLLARYLLLFGAIQGGAETEESKEARATLGRCLLHVSDLLVSPKMTADLRNNAMPKPKRAMLLQLSAASGFEINNPPNMGSSIVRSDILFGEILRRTPSNLKLAAIFKERTGMEITEYIDYNIGTLVNYLARDPNELMGKADPYFLNPATFFPSEVKDSAEHFWKLELGSLDGYRDELKADTKLAPHHNFTPFRKRPFLKINGTCIPIHLCFVQEKLEAGLFWTIFHTLKDETERDALFTLWGRLFETYIIETMTDAAKGKNQFLPFPRYKDNQQEAFDGILSNGKICVVFESKAGFLKTESKFSEDPELLKSDLDDKFGSSKTGALWQMASNITQVFSKNPAQRREINGLDLTKATVVVPALVVQERFVSSPLTGYLLADKFRSALRKQRLSREIDCQCQGLIVMDAYDVEALRVCNSGSAFDLLDCIHARSHLGDQVYDFRDFLVDYAGKNRVSLKSDPIMQEKIKTIFERVSARFFRRSLTNKAQSHPSK